MTKPDSFSAEECQHYERHFMLNGFGVEAQSKLKHAKVLVVGAGGLGCPVLQYLAAAGVGTLGVIDGDVVDVTNLQRQILFTVDDVGNSKAETAQKRLGRMNPHIRVEAHNAWLDEQNAVELFNQYDLVVDGSDNFRTRYLISDACVLTKRPLVSAAIYQFEGQVGVFNYEGSATYRCLFPEPPPAGAVPNCSEVGVLGVLPGIFGTLQANEVLKIITGCGEVLAGQLLTLDLKTMKQRILRCPLNPENLTLTELKPVEQPRCVAPVCGDLAWLKAHLQDPAYLFVDVREAWERRIVAVEPSRHIPLRQWLGAGPENWADEERHVVFFCKAGIRSLKALEHARAIGVRHASHFERGVGGAPIAS